MTLTVTPALSTGFPRLDALLRGGLRPGTLTMIGARSGDGASTFVYALLRDASIKRGLPAYLATTQESRQNVLAKMLGAEAGVDTSHIHVRRCSPAESERLRENSKRVGTAPLVIDDAVHMSLTHIRVAMRKAIRNKGGLELAVIDSVMPVDAGHDAERCTEEWASRIGPELRAMARSFRIPVIATVPLKWPANGSFRAPSLTDLPEGDFDQWADSLVMLHVTDPDEHRANARGAWGVTVTVAKTRNGRGGSIEFVHEGPFSRFRDAEDVS